MFTSDNKKVYCYIFIAFLASIFVNLALINSTKQTKEDLISDYYETENLVSASPHSLRKKMTDGKNDYILVDTRSAQEYEKAHITGAISIPAYKDPDHSAYDQVDRIVGEFAKLPKDKEIILYCYSTPCMTSRKIGKMLAEKNIFVKHLNIGWNEWRYDWTSWNHEHEWANTKATDYITSGKEPGVVPGGLVPPDCTLNGDTGC